MNIYAELLKEQEQFSVIINALKSKISPIRITGTCETQKVHLAFSLCQELSKGMLYIAPDALTAKFIVEDLKFFDQENVRYFPATDIIFHDVDAKSNESIHERVKVLNDILINNKLLIVTTIQALAQKTINVSVFKNALIKIKSGDIIQIDELSSKLTSIGYKREPNVEFPGQFSVRGGILDIFPLNVDNPYRIEFWDDEIDTIKLFCADTQLSIENISEINVPPATETTGVSDSTLCDYLDNYVAFYDEPHHIEESYNTYVKELKENIINSMEKNNNLFIVDKRIENYLLNYEDITKSIASNLIVGLSNLSTSSRGLKPKEMYSITAKSMPTYKGNLPLMCDDLIHYAENMYRIIIPCESESKIELLQKTLKE